MAILQGIQKSPKSDRTTGHVRSPSSRGKVARGRESTGQDQGVLRMGQGMSRGPSVDMACLGVPEGGHRACSGVPRDVGQDMSRSTRGGHKAFPGVPDNRDRAYPGSGRAGGGALTRRLRLAAGDRGTWPLQARPGTEAGRGQGAPPDTPMGTAGQSPGGPGGGGGSRGGEVLGREAPRSFVARSSPGGRAPQPPPRAGPDFPALFTSEKTFPGPGMLRRSNQAPAPAPPTC